MQANAINAAYLAAAALFILGLRGLASPRTAVRGNLLGALGMFVAVLATLADNRILSYELIAWGVALGSLIGAVWAVRVQMTAMPQLVAAFNGFGGGASALVAASAVLTADAVSDVPAVQLHISSALSVLIGAATLTGSLVAWAKLQGVMYWQPRGGFFACSVPARRWPPVVLGGFSPRTRADAFLLGGDRPPRSFTVSCSRSPSARDMPVVIALLNSCSGLAAAATGFVFGNNVLIIAGSLVGASGLILTRIMCKRP